MNLKSFFLFQYYRLLGYFARRYLKKWQPLVIGINGSVGKTSCRMILDEVLQSHLWDQLSIYTSPKNFNGELGMSLSIFKITKRTPSRKGMLSTIKTILSLLKSDQRPYDILILEYGIDRPKEMEFLCSIVQPHISILTKLDAVHSLQFWDAHAIAHEELKLQKNTLLHCYINNGDEQGMKLSSSLQTKVSIYDTIGKETDIYTSQYTIQHRKDKEFSSPLLSSSLLHFRQKEVSFTTNILGKIHHDYVALSYDITQTIRNQYNLSPLQPKEKLTLHLQAGRFSIFEGLGDSIIIDSSYNSSPLSLRKVIEESNHIKKTLYPDYLRLFILGDMRELWDSEVLHHKQLADYLKEIIDTSDSIILLWQAMTTTYSELQANKNIYHYLHVTQVEKKAKEIINNSKNPYIITIKGSQNTIFLEEVTKELLAHPSDKKFLIRQEKRRDKKKWL